MNFDTNSKTTDIIMFNSRNLGALIVDEKPHVKEWDEPQFGIQNIGIEESYGFGLLNEGKAIAVAKNVRVRRQRVQPGCLRRGLRGFGQRGPRGADQPRRRKPDQRQRGALRRLLITRCVSPRAAAEFRDCCRAGPGAGLGSPAARGFSSLGRPVLEPVPWSPSQLHS
jgi:hypothetical protein